LDAALFVVKRVREFSGDEKEIRSAIAAAGLGNIQVAVCTLEGISESNFSKAIPDIVCPPFAIISIASQRKPYALLMTETNEIWSSTNLWEQLTINDKWWFE
jgi:hypothetical protein